MAHSCLLQVVSDVKLDVSGSPVRVPSPLSAACRLLPYLLNAHSYSHCSFSLVTSGTVVAVVRCSSRFRASTSAGVRTFRLLFLYVLREFAHFTQNFAPRWAAISLPSITVRLTFLTHSVRMRPNFQGLPWFEFDGLGEDNY